MQYVSRKALMAWLSPEEGKKPAEWPGKLSPHYTIMPGWAAEALPEGMKQVTQDVPPTIFVEVAAGAKGVWSAVLSQRPRSPGGGCAGSSLRTAPWQDQHDGHATGTSSP